MARGSAWQGPWMAGGLCGKGDMHGKGACMAGGGHVWWGVCVTGGMHGGGHAWQWGHVWQGGHLWHTCPLPPPDTTMRYGQ